MRSRFTLKVITLIQKDLKTPSFTSYFSTIKDILFLLFMAALGLGAGALCTSPVVASGEPYLGAETQIATSGGITKTLFTDEFNDGEMGTAWTTSQGSWVENGILSMTSTDSGDRKKALISNSGVTFPDDGITITAKVRVDYWVEGGGARVGVALAQNTSGNGYNLVFHGDHSTVQFLDDWVAWGPSYTFDWSEGVWYWFKLKKEEGTLWGKVWEDGTPEPGDWPYTWDRSGRSGYPGLNGGATRDGGVSMASFDDVTMTSADSGTLFADDFDDGDLGSDWTTTDGTWAAESVLSQTSTALGDRKKALISDSGVAFPGNGLTIIAKVRVDHWVEGGGARAGVSLGQSSGGVGYNLVLQDDHSTVRFLHDYVAWGPSYTFEWSEGVWYWFKLKMEDGTLWGKVWEDGTAEPEGWPYTWERDGHSGYPGLNGGATRDGGVSTVSFDEVRVMARFYLTYLPLVLR